MKPIIAYTDPETKKTVYIEKQENETVKDFMDRANEEIERVVDAANKKNILGFGYAPENKPTSHDLSTRVPLSQRPPESVTGIKKMYQKRFIDKLQGKDKI